MANLTFSEKQLIETVFGMSGGYVLNFFNQLFDLLNFSSMPGDLIFVQNWDFINEF